jgi:transcriptional regulator with XRE-family HTH domain
MMKVDKCQQKTFTNFKTVLEYRQVKGLTQKELAKKLGVSRETVSRWEKGVMFPEKNHLKAMSLVFDVPLSAIEASFAVPRAINDLKRHKISANQIMELLVQN